MTEDMMIRIILPIVEFLKTVINSLEDFKQNMYSRFIGNVKNAIPS